METPASAAPLPGAILVPDAPGVYEYTSPGAPPWRVAVGLSPEESDLSPASADRPWLALAPPDGATPASSPASLIHTRKLGAERLDPLWWWAFAALGLFALAELGLANRTAR